MAFALVALALGSPAPGAAEYCVTCSGPDAAYRCAIEGTPEGPGTDPRAQLMCISRLAETGRHESCSVSRQASYPCAGELKVIAAPNADPAAAVAPPAVPGSPPPPPGVPAALPPAKSPAEPAPAADPAAAPPPAEKAPPRTVEELAGETVESSKEGLKKAGDAIKGTGEKVGEGASAVGSAVKKGWNCLTSLFSEC